MSVGEYVVQAADTLERVAARHDCTPSELVKLNRLGARTVWPGQRLKIPPLVAVPPPPPPPPPPPLVTAADVADDGIAPAPGRAVRASLDDADAECLTRFLKLKVKQLTESEGVVSGTLLVTPNCLMFDPDVTHPLVRENGTDPYGLVAPMEHVVSIAVFKDFAALTGEQPAAPYAPADYSLDDSPFDAAAPDGRRRQTSDGAAALLDAAPADGSAQSTSCPLLPVAPAVELSPQRSSPSSARESQSSDEALRGGGRRKKFGSIKAIGERASSLGDRLSGKLTTGAQVVSSGVQSVASDLTSGSRAAAGVSPSPAASSSGGGGADSLTTGAKAAAGRAVNIVNMSSGLFAPASQPNDVVMDVDEQWFAADDGHSLKRKESLARLQTLRVKTQLCREEATQRLRFSCATDAAERPDLFRPVDEMLPATPPSPTELPFYMCVRLNRRARRRAVSRAQSAPSEPRFGNRLKREFWFTVPRDKVDTLYAFLLQWSPEKYGLDEHSGDLEEKGFLLLDDAPDEAELDASPLSGSLLNREWEIVTVEEVRRRLSLSELAGMELPLPRGASTSRLLDEAAARQLCEQLPARAEGYPWRLIYCSEQHGFSLRTLYRLMVEWAEELSPTLLCVRDTRGAIFGAVASAPLRPSEHYFGTGDASYVWTLVGGSDLRVFGWTGANDFFVQAAGDSLAFGAGGGHYGLWLDADLNHGRSRRCDTFANPPLASAEDFIVADVEAWGFSID